PEMVSVVVCLALGLVLVVAAVLKAAGGAAARAAVGTYGIRGPRVAGAVWGGLIAVEVVLGIAVGAGLAWAARVVAVLMAGAAAAQVVAIASGRAGAPCACFGAKGRLSSASAGRAALLAAALAVAPVLPREEPSAEGWLAIGLGFALLGLVALAVVVLALAREVGMLRLSVAPRGALEVAHEGPEIGARSALAAAFGARLTPGTIGLAVFTSEGCGLCRALAPAVAAFGAHPAVTLRTFDEVEDADAWAAADVPGSPFAVALDGDGTVLAKGTFNTGAQLESVLAAAERRRGAVRA
ncbi:MAG TPA: MauE/DoxX family redox-associated membrane protein, partial [Solirubrobacter sp.]|nr:MauE/DoxX family redox-associated membrane protein [Solirubrobacter sp.]